jgi:hypothetical protein
LVQTLEGRFGVTDQHVTLNGKAVKIPKGPIQIQFWTPSARTKEAVDVKDWEKMDSDDKLDVFAGKLMQARIIKGYRRYEVTGAGFGSRRVGAWWVSSNDTDFNIGNFLRTYLDFWKPGDDKVYMEIQPIESGHS